MFQKAKWIWQATEENDTYVDFFTSCDLLKPQGVKMRIAADSDYALYINGQYAASGQYQDYPWNRAYDEMDISEFLKDGPNTFEITVWYIGESSSNYCHGEAGLIFEIEAGGEILLASDRRVLCRKSDRYVSGRKQSITPQLGYGFCLDMRKENSPEQASESREKPEMPFPVHQRENKKLVIMDRIIPEIVGQGTFRYNQKEETDGAKMQRAFLSFSLLTEIGKKEGNSWSFSAEEGGLYLIFDLQKETAGFLDFDIETDKECMALVGWGEHLRDGRCRTEIAFRDYSSALRLKKGRNAFMPPFRRLGCRYLQLFLETDHVKIHYFGIRPTEYPLQVLPFASGNPLRDAIYDASVNTLRLCMHEHYEDCPWREQSFYTLDSYSQMLFGYEAFGEIAFPRSALRLLAAGIREDGLLPITAPTDWKLNIPIFSLIFVFQVWSYFEHSGDRETVEHCFPAMETIINTFISRMDEKGLVPNFEGETYWNFYEWQPYLDGGTYQDIKYDLCINAVLSYVLETWIQICRLLKTPDEQYVTCRERLNETIRREFFDTKTGLFRLCLLHDADKISVLGNAWCVLCGAADGLDNTAIELLLKENGEGAIKGIPATLAMCFYRYEALLKLNAEKYRDWILTDIDQTYLYMLQNGATSFWETIKGEADFENAGSLCHGWSALPIYYYRKFGITNK